jgi:pyrroline-5-carboxylate reductase
MDSQIDQATHQLGFLGGGKLAGSIIHGLIRSKFCEPADIIVGEPNDETREKLHNETRIKATAENAEVAEKSKIIFVGVKPAVVLPVLRGLTGQLKDKLVISLAAGVRLIRMEAATGARFMRALTNTPSTVCRGATALARGSRSTNEDADVARQIFSAIGLVIEIQEDQIDFVTALSGSGPAFVYTVIEALAKGGSKMGLSHELALKLATQTVLGAAQLALETKLSPEELRRMVVSPGGTTAAGLAAMEKLGTTKGLIAAVEAATKRSQEMAEENR